MLDDAMLTLWPPEHELRRSFEEGVFDERSLGADPLLRRWSRSRAARRPAAVRESAPAIPFARELLELCPDLSQHGLAVLLADRDGVILASRGVELLDDSAVRAALVDGMRLGEPDVGTNAIGTALAERVPVAVIGGAHYEAAFAQICCYAAPIHDPSGRLIGVIDISGPATAATPLLGVMVKSFAATIEANLRERAPSRVASVTPVTRDAPPSAAPPRIDPKITHILDALPVAVWVADAEGNLCLSNAAARRLWAGEIYVPLEEYDRFKAWWPDGRRVGAADWGLPRALRSGEVIIDDEVKIEAFDGSRKVIRNGAAPILDDRGRVVGGIATNEDLTSFKRAEATRDLFTGVLGHDLRGPLGAIVMAASLLDGKDDLSASQRTLLRRIGSSATRIQHLIDSLLDLTRARSGMGFPVDGSPTDMGEVCGDIVEETRVAYPSRTISFERRGVLNGVWDAERVAQVISNLVRNGIQHGQDPIVVTAEGFGDSVVVSVSNRGEPIPEANRASLFEPFRRGRSSEGLGLGLFIAREILRSHGGTIDVASTDRATTFITRWPRFHA
jgi:signal transduction histidine kinase